jgi:predicted nuclease with TOPRIM domain
MQLDNLVSLIGSLSAAAVVIYAGWRRGTSNVWKEEAEAQKARADRLEDDLNEIKERLSRIEKENARLIELLTALDPERLRALRI